LFLTNPDKRVAITKIPSAIELHRKRWLARLIDIEQFLLVFD
jgi:hypothetical protein